MPPALLLYHPLIERYLVLDGHDRIHAALLEGGVPPAVALFPMTEHSERLPAEEMRAMARGAETLAFRDFPKSPAFIDSLNETARRAYGDTPARPVFAARPFSGGAAAWGRMIERGLPPHLRDSDVAVNLQADR